VVVCTPLALAFTSSVDRQGASGHTVRFVVSIESSWLPWGVIITAVFAGVLVSATGVGIVVAQRVAGVVHVLDVLGNFLGPVVRHGQIIK